MVITQEGIVNQGRLITIESVLFINCLLSVSKTSQITLCQTEWLIFLPVTLAHSQGEPNSGNDTSLLHFFKLTTLKSSLIFSLLWRRPCCHWHCIQNSTSTYHLPTALAQSQLDYCNQSPSWSSCFGSGLL